MTTTTMQRARVLPFFILAVLIADPGAAQMVPVGSSPPPVLLSRQVAARAHVGVGDVVTLAADSTGKSARKFRVAGIHEPTPDPMRFTLPRLEARLHLPDLLELTGDVTDPAAADRVDAINVRLASPADAEGIAADLAARMPGLNLRPTSRASDSDPFAVLDRFHIAISLVTVAGSTAFLLALMIIRAEERREAVGAMRLLGISRRSLLTEVAIEGLVIASAGAVFGTMVALGAEGIVNKVFQTRYDTTLVFLHVTRSIAARSIAIALPLGVATGIAASWTLLRRNILSLVGR